MELPMVRVVVERSRGGAVDGPEVLRGGESVGGCNWRCFLASINRRCQGSGSG